MEIEVQEQTEELTRVALSGRMDTAGVDAVENRFNAAIAPRSKDAIVDVSGVEFVSSMGIRMLLTMARTLARRNARLVLQSPQPLVIEALEAAALTDVIPIAADEAAARALLGRPIEA